MQRFALLRDSVFLQVRRAKIEHVRGVVSIVGADSCREVKPQPPPIWPSRNKLAQQTWRRVFDCDPSMVTFARAVVAHASCASDNHIMYATGKEFERNPLNTFVVSLAADVDAESHSVHRLANCTVDLASICVVAAVLLII